MSLIHNGNPEKVQSPNMTSYGGWTFSPAETLPADRVARAPSSVP